MKSPAAPKQVFCSKEHMQQFISFEESGRGNIPKLPGRSLVKRILSMIIALVVIAAILHVMGWIPKLIPLPFYDMF